MSKEALKLALEALEESLGYVQEEAENAQRLYGQYPTRQARIQGLKDDARKHMDAITALREALAQSRSDEERPAPVAKPHEQQEPVAWWHQKSDTFTSGSLVSNFVEWTPLYTSPPASKPLTVEQIAELDCNDHYKFARAIEAAHGIKENRND